MRRLLVFLPLLFPVLGCTGPVLHVTDPGPATVGPGWTAASDPTTGVSLCYPPGWQPGRYPKLSLTLPDMGASGGGAPSVDPANLPPALQEMAKQTQADADADAAKEKADELQKGIVLVFNDGNRPTPGEINTHFNLEIMKGTSNLNDAVGTMRQEIMGSDVSDVVTPIGNAKKLVSDVTTIGGDEVHQIAWIWIDGSNGYCLHFLCTGPKSLIEAVAEPTMQTVRIHSPAAAT